MQLPQPLTINHLPLIMFFADLQIHSCLSPCGSLDCSPAKIVDAAVKKKLDIIALTDHNTAENCPAFAKTIEATPNISGFYGIEVNSVEEIHLICLFGNVDIAVEFGTFIISHLPDEKNNPKFFGDQPVVDAEENIIKIEDAFLAAATDLSLNEITNQVHNRSGIIIASHIDRTINSLFSQLGIWPDDIKIDGCDLSFRGEEEKWRIFVPENIPFIRTSDAHYLEDIGKQSTKLDLKEPTFEEFKKLFKT
ncbi:MAG: PHP domain-containing protein [Alphaproteobacteria bacterium]